MTRSDACSRSTDSVLLDPAAPVVAPTAAKEPEAVREVEIEIDDLNALRLAAAGGGPGLTRESLEHAFGSVELESA